MALTLDDGFAERVFSAVVRLRIWTLLLGMMLMAAAGAGLVRLNKDPSTDSLIPPDHSSVTTRDYAEEVFGLRDPIVVALIAEGANGIFTPTGLAALKSAQQSMEALPNVRRDRVVSIASESRIYGDELALKIEPYFEATPTTQAESDAVRKAVFSSDLPSGVLVSADGSGALIIAELHDQSAADATYREAMARLAPLEDATLKVHVAGQGAVSGYLSGLIDRDSRRLPLLAVTIIFGLIYLAFRSTAALVAPLIVIAATVVGAIGTMAWLGISYFVITSALPVILIAIAVADSIHILTGYYARRADAPETPVDAVIIETLCDLWRPLTLTTFTTMAGCIGIGVASSMPPIGYFGWFAALGVLIAWACSLFILPGVLSLLAPRPSPLFATGRPGPFSGALTGLALAAARAPVVFLAVSLIGAGVGAYYTAKVEVDRSQIENFRRGLAIRDADEVLNARFAGTSYLDVVVETSEPSGLLDARRISKLRELQDYAEGLPFVTKARSIADIIGEIHSALHPDTESGLPKNDDAVAQYLLLYESSGDPAELEDEIDYAYERALVRIYLNARYTSEEASAVESLGAYLEQTFNEPGMTGALSGRVNVDYHWMDRLEKSHRVSIAVSAFLVFAAASLLFRSFVFGLLSLAPVAGAILSVYAVMGANGIFIEPATSMFAAISIGVGVDFAIHFIDRLQHAERKDGLTAQEAISTYFPAATRATFLNAATLGLGFSALMVSELPPLFKFGLLIAIAATASYFAGLVVTTAVFALIRDRRAVRRAAPQATAVGALICIVGVTASDRAHADEALDALTGDQIARLINARNEGEAVDRHITMELANRSGRPRIREARALRLRGDGVKKSIIVFTAPKSLRDTAFLTHDQEDADASDRRWLYLPASQRPKQIPSSDRGDYFLGTDFSYEDIANELKFDLDDYTFRRVPRTLDDADELVRIEAIPESAETARELGYGRLEAVVDTQNWMPVQIIFDDVDGRLLKTVDVRFVEEIDGVWTPGRLEVRRHDVERSTVFTYSNIVYGAPLDDSAFTPQALRRGVR